MFSFAALAHDLFPRLPDSVVDPRGTWVDTLRWHTDGQRAEVVSRSAYTYTLVGDTLVDGRGLLHIAVAGKVDLMVFVGRPGRLTRRHMTGSSTGIVLWDPERRLAAYHEYERDSGGNCEQTGQGTVRAESRGAGADSVGEVRGVGRGFPRGRQGRGGL